MVPLGATWIASGIGIWMGAGCGYDHDGFLTLSVCFFVMGFATTYRDFGSDGANGYVRSGEELYDRYRLLRRKAIFSSTSPDCEIAEDSSRVQSPPVPAPYEAAPRVLFRDSGQPGSTAGADLP